MVQERPADLTRSSMAKRSLCKKGSPSPEKEKRWVPIPESSSISELTDKILASLGCDVFCRPVNPTTIFNCYQTSPPSVFDATDRRDDF